MSKDKSDVLKCVADGISLTVSYPHCKFSPFIFRVCMLRAQNTKLVQAITIVTLSDVLEQAQHVTFLLDTTQQDKSCYVAKWNFGMSIHCIRFKSCTMISSTIEVNAAVANRYSVE